MIYKGDGYVFVGLSGERSPFGFWSYSYMFEGVPSAVQALIAAQPVGPVISTVQNGAVVSATLKYSPDMFFDKWEIDRENLDKDLMFLKAFAGISDAGKGEIRRWRASGDTITNLDTTKDSANSALMTQVGQLVQQGVEVIQVSTLVLKRSRSLSTTLAPTIVLTEQTTFYSTAKLIEITGMDPEIGATLPTVPYAPPANTQWGWLPRLSNRSYVAQGEMQEHSDWVFAAWSTILYAYSS